MHCIIYSTRLSSKDQNAFVNQHVLPFNHEQVPSLEKLLNSRQFQHLLLTTPTKALPRSTKSLLSSFCDARFPLLSSDLLKTKNLLTLQNLLCEGKDHIPFLASFLLRGCAKRPSASDGLFVGIRFCFDTKLAKEDIHIFEQLIQHLSGEIVRTKALCHVFVTSSCEVEWPSDWQSRPVELSTKGLFELLFNWDLQKFALPDFFTKGQLSVWPAKQTFYFMESTMFYNSRSATRTPFQVFDHCFAKDDSVSLLRRFDLQRHLGLSNLFFFEINAIYDSPFCILALLKNIPVVPIEWLLNKEGLTAKQAARTFKPNKDLVDTMCKQKLSYHFEYELECYEADVARYVLEELLGMHKADNAKDAEFLFRVDVEQSWQTLFESLLDTSTPEAKKLEEDEEEQERIFQEILDVPLVADVAEAFPPKQRKRKQERQYDRISKIQCEMKK
jgi:hypothetical protein